jgi:hypothetical protein
MPDVPHGRDRPLAIALGGGGAFGIGFHLGVLDALGAAGVPIDDAPMLGVSAGAWAAAARASGRTIDDLAAGWRWGELRHTPNGRFDVRAVTDRVYGDTRDARVRASAIRLPSCRRIIVDGAVEGLSAAVAAASAPPRIAQRQYIRNRRAYDAGVAFNTSADKAGPARSLLVLAPLARGVLGLEGHLWERRLLAETSMWAARHRGRIVIIRPDAAVVAAGARDWTTIMDHRAMLPTYAAAYAQGARIAGKVDSRLRRRYLLAA